MGEERQDPTGPPPIQDHRRISVQEAAEHLGTTVDAIRKRVQRGTIAHNKDPDGRVWILLDTDMTRHDTDQDIGRSPSDSTALISAKDETIATLRDQLEAERQAHAEARRLLMAALERIPPQLEAPSEPRESPVSPGPTRTPTAPPEGAQEGAQRPWWRRMFGG